MSDAILGTIVGAILTGIAVIGNSYISNWLQEQKEARAQKKAQHDKTAEETGRIYEDVLHLFYKLIRNKGTAASDELEQFYKYEIKVRLISTPEILKQFKTLKSLIAEATSKLTPYPEEFIPKFEDDTHRHQRLQARKEAEQTMENEWRECVSNLYKEYTELSNLMKADLDLKKGA